MSNRLIISPFLGFLLTLLLVISSSAEGIRVLPRGAKPKDDRLKPLKDLNGYFPFQVPERTADWEKRAVSLRRQVLVSQGLWPMPTPCDLKPVIHGKRDMGDYTIEYVYFESMPGFYVTGNLYRPVDDSNAKRPAVLCPHGHWANGRFYDCGEGQVKSQIAEGAEHDSDGGRSPLQARCVHLARMGCVVFHYDMVGYADSIQITYELAHRFAKQRPEMSKSGAWGLFSAQAESHGQSVMGLQTFNSMRAIDFVSSLGDVDTDRIAVTGASGGGTQSFMLAALDSRIKAAFPAVMVSTAMQGGCTCENACGLRVGTGNVELAALFAPKPLGLTAADDWTKEMSTKGFPQLKQLYSSYKRTDNLLLVDRTEFKHNFNHVSRLAMYNWFNVHLGLGIKDQIAETKYQRLTPDELTVWNKEHPKPTGGDEFERKLMQWWRQDTHDQLTALVPETEEQWKEYDRVVGGGIDAVLGRGLPDSSSLTYDQTLKQEHDSYLVIGGTITNDSLHEQLPALFIYPKEWDCHVAIWLSRQGKSALYDKPDRLSAPVQRLVDNGVAVCSADLLYQGEYLAQDHRLTQTRRVGNPRQAAAYTFGYNHSLLARRVHDVLTLVSFVRAHEYQPEHISLVGTDGVGAIVAAARAQARDLVDFAAIDTAGFRFADVTDIRSIDFLPGAARFLDLPGMLSVAAPSPVCVAGETPSSLQVTSKTYATMSGKDNLEFVPGRRVAADDHMAHWLLKQIENAN